MEMRNIPLSVPNLDLDILPYIKETIETGWVSTGGRFIAEFEEKIKTYVKTEFAPVSRVALPVCIYHY